MTTGIRPEPDPQPPVQLMAIRRARLRRTSDTTVVLEWRCAGCGGLRLAARGHVRGSGDVSVLLWTTRVVNSWCGIECALDCGVDP